MSWDEETIERMIKGHYLLLAFCGKYGGFPPPLAQEYDVEFLRRYSEAVAQLIEEETKGVKKR